MSLSPNNIGVYVIINNIPKSFPSMQLRSFFTSFVESSGFICFHYLHRPEVQKPSNSADGDKSKKCISYCCVIKVVADRVLELIETYNGQHWLDSNGEPLPTCCLIKEVKLSDSKNTINKDCSWKMRKKLPADLDEFSIKEVESFTELRPPPFMPNGNVGTTTDYLLNEIRMCRLPKRVIRKLGLPFPTEDAERIYNDEARTIYSSAELDSMPRKERLKLKKKLKKLFLNSQPFPEPPSHYSHCYPQLPVEYPYWEEGYYSEVLYPEEKEWAQYEALPDIHEQGRLFEERNGSEWETERSSLDFYPSAQIPNAEGGYVDARTLINSNIDPRFYVEPGYKLTVPNKLPTAQQTLSAGDAQYLQMRSPSFMSNVWHPQLPGGYSYLGNEVDKKILSPEQVEWHQYKPLPIDTYRQNGLSLSEKGIRFERGKRGSGLEFSPNYQHSNVGETYCDGQTLGVGNINIKRPKKPDRSILENEHSREIRSEFAAFEKYNKGIGSKILEAQGWKKGQGIGKNCDGIAEPLPNTGQRNKKGFGFPCLEKAEPLPIQFGSKTYLDKNMLHCIFPCIKD